MNGRERIEWIIHKIEEMSIDSCAAADKIAESISNDLGTSLREINAVFKFLYSQTFLEYIKNRKMMAALKAMLAQDEFNAFRAVDLSGFDNQQSFTKNFTKKFGISPQRAYAAKRSDLYAAPPSWDELAEKDYPPKNNPPKETHPEASHFGLSASIYTRLRKMMELEDLYALPPQCSEAAYSLIESYQIDSERINTVFKYVSDWYELASLVYEPDCDPKRYIDFVQRFVSDPEYLYLCFNVGLSPELAFTVRPRIPDSLDLKALDPQFLYEFAQATDVDFYFYQDAYTYFQDYLSEYPNMYDKYESLESYTEYLCMGYPKEEAINYLVLSDDDDCLSYTAEDLRRDQDDSYWEEALYADELDYSGGSFDYEPDMDNLEYED